MTDSTLTVPQACPSNARHKVGRYEIVAELGRGAMGVVYKALDPVIERTVALKTIHVDLSGEQLANFEERFYREGKSAGRLNHPNIVTIFDAGEADGVAFIAMEFLEGISLRSLLDEQPSLPIPRIVGIAAQAASALAYAHEHGVIHRDIKPSNIMVLGNGTVKLTDFGIARLPTGSDTIAGTVLGSPKYMSPEQVKGEEVDGRSDIFSLGAVLYEMLTGMAPFAGDNVSAILYQVLHAEPAPPGAINPGVPLTVDSIVLRMLAKQGEDRYPSARAVLRELQAPDLGAERAVNQLKTVLDRPQEATATPSAEAPSPASKRRAPLIAGMVLALVAIVTTLALLQQDHPRKPASQTAASPASPAVAESKPPAANRHPALRAANNAPSEPASSKAAKEAPMRTSPEPPRLEPQAAEWPAPQTANARVTLAISPWGEVFVDGKARGTAPPLVELRLPPGTHRVEIRNSSFAPYIATLDLETGASHRIKHKFK
jgi:eukaryotic-like serine/threonine-protein kinase